MRINRRAPRNQLAFLDVMACGLGAVILLFLIVRHHAETATARDADTRAADQLAQLEELNAEAAALAEQLEQARYQNAERHAQLRSMDADRARLAELERALELAEARKAALSEQVKSMDTREAADVIEERNLGEEQYLLGLRVAGPRIAILVDRSASMTDARLIDVITRKVRSDAEKQRGAKWQRTLRTVRWLLQRVPENSEVTVIAFNDKARALGGGGWNAGRDQAALTGLFQALGRLIPTGATNLEAGLLALGKLSPGATDVYVVTDGLPTQSVNSPGLGSGCSRKQQKVSGECREALFYASLRHSAPRPGIKVHVILLPLEGDPQAAPAYWNWTAQAGGLLITPANNWP